MIRISHTGTIGLLFSGGLDSAILLGHLAAAGQRVQPFYIRSNLCWQHEEFSAIEAYIDAVRRAGDGPAGFGNICEVVVLDLPMDDLYGEHWSVTGRETPGAETDDAAVFLPGRNPLLVIKAALWCALHGIDSLALASLAANPFADAREPFFSAYEAALNRATDGHPNCGRVQLLRPFSRLSKRQVMQMGHDLPLALTFSCIRPMNGLHCGACNKCAERRKAFEMADMDDTTEYVAACV